MHGSLRADVAGRVEHACCDPEARARGEEPRRRAGGDPRHDDREPHPGAHLRPRRRRSRVRAARERDPEQEQARNRHADAEPVATWKPLPCTPLHEEREEPDAARRGRLHERQGREPERRHVEHPAADPRHEAGHPGKIPEERPQRPQRVADRERRQIGSGAVLDEVAPVDGGRRPERQQQADADAEAHSAGRAAKGRYDSAARAATPTRGRSRRRSTTT